jgi:hypothetical protein
MFLIILFKCNIKNTNYVQPLQVKSEFRKLFQYSTEYFARVRHQYLLSFTLEREDLFIYCVESIVCVQLCPGTMGSSQVGRKLHFF